MKKTLFTALTKTRQAVYKTLASFDKNVTKQSNPIFVLSYHSIANDSWRFSVSEKALKEQIEYLQEHFTIVTLKDLQNHISGKKMITRPSVVLTFDDGYKDILQWKEYFAKRNITPALFILSNTKNPNWKELGTKREFLTPSDIKSLLKLDWEIGSHSATHANLATLNDKELQKEIVDAKADLEKSIGQKVNYFAYPRGKYDENVVRYIKEAKYTMALTMDDGFIQEGMDMLRIPRVGIDNTHTFEEFKATFSPSVVRFRKIIKESPAGKYL